MLRGTQHTAVTDDKQSIRFVATLDTLDYDVIGFRMTVSYTVNGERKTVEIEKTCGYVYEKLLATENGTVKDVTASELGGKYLYVLAVNQVPANAEEVTFVVTPYATASNGTVVTGETVTVVYENGQPK